MLQSCPHIRTKSIVIIIENANKGNDIGQRSGGTSNSRFKRWGYHETEQKASSLVDISHRQVYCLELGGSIISKSSKKLNVLLNGFLTKRPPPIDNPRQASSACRGHFFSSAPHSSRFSRCGHSTQTGTPHPSATRGCCGLHQFFITWATSRRFRSTRIFLASRSPCADNSR